MLAALLVSWVVAPQIAGEALKFELVGGRIYVPAKVNGHDTSAIVDTGAAATVLDLALAEEWKLESEGQVDARGAGGGTAKGKILRGVKATLGAITEPVPYAVPLGSLNEAEGRRLETVIGYPFFRDHVVEIDYAERRLRVFDRDVDAAPKGTVIPIRIVANKPHVAVTLRIGGTEHVGEAMVDTGASTTGLTAKFVRGHPLDVKATPKAIIGGGVGGFVEGRYFRPDAVKIGPLEFARPILSLPEGDDGFSAAGAFDFLIAADLLSRSRVTFDYSRERMVLEPGADFSKPFEADKTGLQMRATSPDLRAIRVVRVMPGSSAEQAGVRADDVIETVDGAPASRFTLQELREHFRSPTTAKWELGLRRGDRRITLSVPAKSIL